MKGMVPTAKLWNNLVSELTTFIQLTNRHASNKDRGLTEAEPHAKRIMETEIWSTRDAEKQGIGIVSFQISSCIQHFKSAYAI